MNKVLLLIFCVLYQLDVFCQLNKKVVVNITPQNSIVKIDGEFVKNISEVSLNSGFHKIQAWAPDRKEFSDSIFIDTNTIKFSKLLPFTEDYKQYKTFTNRFKLEKAAFVNVPIYASILTLGLGINEYSKMKGEEKMSNDLLEKANIAISSYKIAKTPKELKDYKERYDESYGDYLKSIDKQNQFRRNINLFATSTVVGVLTAYCMNKLYKNKKNKILKPLNIRPSWAE